MQIIRSSLRRTLPWCSLLLWASFVGAHSKTSSDISRGEFSADATSLGESKAPRRFTIISPDTQNSIIVHDSGEGQSPGFEAFMTLGEKRLPLFDGQVDPEVLWSPDSKAFAETYSDGGAVGQFHVLIYYIGHRGLRTVEPTARVTQDFLSHPHYCYWDEDPNIGAVAWLQNSSRLLVAAEFPPHSNCEEMGMFRAYEITVPSGQIIKSYDQLTAKRLFWPHLGDELRAADDECVKKPKSCQAEAIKLGRKLFIK